eukprot:scaffold98609_cov30-Phaeocystis_antarctica.AAC.1
MSTSSPWLSTWLGVGLGLGFGLGVWVRVRVRVRVRAAHHDDGVVLLLLDALAVEDDARLVRVKGEW